MRYPVVVARGVDFPPVATLAARISRIGSEMVACRSLCEGIARNQARGVLPRGLILEDARGSDGVIVCGMNPGNARPGEELHYREAGPTYAVEKAYWKSHISSIPYFRRVRNLVRALGFSGPILWTDIAKCQRSDSTQHMSFATHPQTFRFCASRYLAAEINSCPLSWPLIANGREAFTALSYLFPKRPVIGIAHSTGAYPQFSKMWKGGKLRPEVRRLIRTCCAREPAVALWIGGAA